MTFLITEGLDGAKALIYQRTVCCFWGRLAHCERTCVSMNIVPLNFWPEFLMGSTPLEDGHAGPGIKELPREQVRHGFRSLPARTRGRLSFPVRSQNCQGNCHLFNQPSNRRRKECIVQCRQCTYHVHEYAIAKFQPSKAGSQGQGQRKEVVPIQVQPTARVKGAECTQMLCQFRHNCVGPKHCCQGTG